MNPTEQIIEESKKLKKEVREKTLGYILTALGLVAGLAWNEAIKNAIETIIPGDKGTLWAQFVYAIVITIFVVVVATYLTKWVSKQSE